MGTTSRETPVLVTGAPRSGTTWVGAILAAAPHTGQLYEPFNLNNRLLKIPFTEWYKYICDENSDEYYRTIQDLISWEYASLPNIKSVRSLADLARVIKDELLFFEHRMKKDRPIVKDPIAIFSTEWLAKSFGMNVLILVRHPAAFFYSIKLQKWSTNFDHFLKQPLLLDRYLQKYASEIEQHACTKKDLLSNAALLWRCIYHTVDICRKTHRQWEVVKHEDISAAPLEQFQRIFSTFGLKFSEHVREKILTTTDERNPEVHGADIARNTRENISIWKQRLSGGEIQRIKEETSDVWPLFYAETDW